MFKSYFEFNFSCLDTGSINSGAFHDRAHLGHLQITLFPKLHLCLPVIHKVVIATLEEPWNHGSEGNVKTQ
jgi:hypothetical protein